MAKQNEPEIEYELTAKVDGVAVYRQTSGVLEVIEMSLLDASRCVEKAVEDLETEP